MLSIFFPLNNCIEYLGIQLHLTIIKIIFLSAWTSSTGGRSFNPRKWRPQSSPDIQLMDWKDLGEYYIMILERPIRCEVLFDFVQHHGSRIDEDLARVVMRQATQAAYMSCQRGVLHQDIKKENLLINKDTLEVKLIDFGCGDLLQCASYTTFMGMYWSHRIEITPVSC